MDDLKRKYRYFRGLPSSEDYDTADSLSRSPSNDPPYDPKKKTKNRIRQCKTFIR